LNLGFKSAFNSLSSGITGLVTKPKEGGEKGGILGFFKGAA
jgi:vacuolar protein sorting-associated protein 13A/C